MGDVDPIALSEGRSSTSMCVGMSLLAGASTTLGAGVVFALPGHRVSPEQMAFVLSLAAGVMLSVTILEFWLPMLGGGRQAGPVIIYSFLGAAAFLALSWLVPEPDMVESVAPSDADKMAMDDEELALSTRKITTPCSPGHVGFKDNNGARQRSWRLAAVMMLALTAHNFPEGFAVAVSALESSKKGSIVMFAIAMHNIPEGIAIAVPVLDATGSRWKALLMSFLSGMAEPLGALFALWLLHVSGGKVSDATLDNLLCAVGGVMSAVALKELLPEALHQHRPSYTAAGFVSGFILMWMTIKLGA